MPRPAAWAWAALHLVRRRGLADQLAIATLLPVLTVVAAVIFNVRLMFISAARLDRGQRGPGRSRCCWPWSPPGWSAVG